MIARDPRGLDWIAWEGDDTDDAELDREHRFDCNGQTECASVWTVRVTETGTHTLNATRHDDGRRPQRADAADAARARGRGRGDAGADHGADGRPDGGPDVRHGLWDRDRHGRYRAPGLAGTGPATGRRVPEPARGPGPAPARPRSHA